MLKPLSTRYHGQRNSAKNANTTPVDAVRHKDKRKNIPTEELRDFVADDEQNPQAVLYPRNPDLDPQFVWKGKDQQDASRWKCRPCRSTSRRRSIRRPSSRIFGRALARRAGGQHGAQLDLFADFNGLPEEFDQRVDFYHHDGNWSNRLILGNSLLVMTSLAEKENLKGRGADDLHGPALRDQVRLELAGLHPQT